MTPQIHRISIALLVLFGALFVNLNVLALISGDDLANHPANRRVIVREYAIERGPLVVGEEAVALSTPTEGEFRYRREYPQGPLYAHLTGYYSLVLQRSGLERALNEELTGRPTEVIAQNLGELLGRSQRAGNAVELTIDPRVQQAAHDALDGRTGAVVAIEPSTGAVLASYANPTFDPDPLSSHDPRTINEAWARLQDDPDRPLLDRATSETYPPGSVFKILVTAAALEAGMDPDSMFADEAVYDVPQTTADIRNFGGGVCADGNEISLADAFRVSCNTVYAELGVQLGDEALRAQAERFGFNHQPPYELSVATSVFPGDLDTPSLAQSAIGQRDVRATAMHFALIAAAVANGGELTEAHVVDQVRDPDGQPIARAQPGRWRDPPGSGTAVSPRTAAQLRQMMLDTVRSGTGTAAAIDGVEVGGKTGTAQDGETPTAWFVGFAGDDVAVAVVVPDAGAGATGGGVAAPIARAVLRAAVEGR